MKTVFDKLTRDGLIARVKTINEGNTAEWGNMNVYQMLKHCVLVEEMYLGKKEYKRMFLGRLLGRMALKSMLKDDSPMSKNAPTGAGFKVQESNGNVPAEKEKWIALIEAYVQYPNPGLVHWFFGKMTKEEVGYLAYKHIDHHLRQFNS